MKIKIYKQYLNFFRTFITCEKSYMDIGTVQYNLLSKVTFRPRTQFVRLLFW